MKYHNHKIMMFICATVFSPDFDNAPPFSYTRVRET